MVVEYYGPNKLKKRNYAGDIATIWLFLLSAKSYYELGFKERNQPAIES